MTTITLKDTLESIDAVIKNSNEHIEMGKALTRLKQNKDFVKVIEEGYLKDESDKLFKLLTDPRDDADIDDDDIRLRLKAINQFKGYVGTDTFKGTIMTKADAAPGVIAREELFRLEVTANAEMENN
jgi:hypothetical protein